MRKKRTVKKQKREIDVTVVLINLHCPEKAISDYILSRDNAPRHHTAQGLIKKRNIAKPSVRNNGQMVFYHGDIEN